MFYYNLRLHYVLSEECSPNLAVQCQHPEFVEHFVTVI